MLEIGMNRVVMNYGFKNVLKDVNLEVLSGERVALIGRNGSGKSTILKIISGEEKPSAGTVSIRRGATVGFLPQIPRPAECGETVRDVLMQPFAHLTSIERRMRTLEAEMVGEREAAKLAALMRSYAYQQSLFEAQNGYATEEAFSKIASGFGLTDILNRAFAVLSGGQKTITLLARTILFRPDILLLDEPTNHLDMRTLQWLEAYLSGYPGTVLLVSHDRYFLDAVAQKTILLEDGECTTFAGNYTYCQREQERRLVAEFEQYKNQKKMIEAMKAAIRRFRDWGEQGNNKRLFRKAKQLELRLSKLEALDRPQLEKPTIPIQFSGGRTGRDTLRVEGLSLSAGETKLFDRATFTVFYRERACLLGDNGTGKTTLVRAILGEAPPESGTIFVAEGARIGCIRQEIAFPDERMSVLEAFIDECPCPEGAARNILAKFFFIGAQVNKHVSALSGGEKVMLKLAMLQQREINFLILDEPTNHIDMETREILEDALMEFGGTILFISHDRYFIHKLADRMLVLRDRSIKNYGCDYETYVEYAKIE